MLLNYVTTGVPLRSTSILLPANAQRGRHAPSARHAPPAAPSATATDPATLIFQLLTPLLQQALPGLVASTPPKVEVLPQGGQRPASASLRALPAPAAPEPPAPEPPAPEPPAAAPGAPGPARVVAAPVGEQAVAALQGGASQADTSRLASALNIIL